MRDHNRYRCSSLIIVLFLSPLLVLSGQNIPSKANTETIRLIQEATDEKGKETGAVIILKDYQMSVNEKGQTRLIIRILGKVFTKEAMSDYSQIPLSFNSYYEEPALTYARVINKDGTIREVPKDAVQIKTTPDSEGLQYTDSRYFSFALSGMEVGAAFDFQVSFSQKIQTIKGEWYDNHLFVNLLRNLSPPNVPRIDPTLTSRYTLLLPKGTRFQYRIYSGEPEHKRRSSGNQDEYQWIFTNLPSVKIEESMPPLSKLTPVILVSSVDDWAQIDKWAEGRLLSKVEITDEIREKSKELTIGRNSNEEKIKAISDFIQSNIQYIYADLDRGGYTPHPAGEIFKSRYGDCKDQSILLISMLKAVGIEAFPALLNPYPYDELYDVPLPAFSHLITYIPNAAGDIWLDMTSGVTPFPNLFFPDQGRMAFIVDGKGGRLSKTPVDDAGKNFSIYDLKASFTGGKATMIMKIEASGVQSDILKASFKSVNADLREQSLKQMVKSVAEKADLDTIRLSDVNNPDVPFSVDIRYDLDSVWLKGQEDFTFGSHSLFPLSLLGNIDVRSAPGERDNDILGAYSYKIIGTERYSPPGKDLLPVAIPPNDSIKNGFFDFIQTFSREGNVSLVKWSLTVSDSDVPADKYESYVNGFQSLKDLVSWKISYVNPVSYISSVLNSENSNEILSFANNLLKDDPKNILAFLLKGMVYNRSGQYDPAIRVFQELIKIVPDNKYAYLYMAFPYLGKRNNETALTNLNKSIKLDSEFEEAISIRSAIYFEQGLYEKSLSDLDMILRANPQNIFYLNRKSTVLAKMGKEAESIAVLEDALKKDTLNADLCTILAQAYLSQNSYRKAIDLYYRAINIDGSKAINYGNLGWAYYLSNDDKKCIEFSRKAIEIDPAAYYARYNLGLANLRTGNITEARNIYGELKEEENSITDSAKIGAIKDLFDLKAQGINTKEVKAILKDFFGI